MKLTIPQWLGIALLSLVVLARVNATPKPPTPTPDTPSAELQAAVAPVGVILKGHADAPRFAALWRAMAANVAMADSPIKTNAECRSAMAQAGAILFRAGKGGPVGTAVAIDAALKQMLGDSPDAFDRTKAAAALNALAWSAT